MPWFGSAAATDNGCSGAHAVEHLCRELGWLEHELDSPSVDVVGVTEDGTHVAGLHPLFKVSEGEDWYVGYFAYQYDPDAQPHILGVEALGRLKQTKFRGVASEKTAFGCAAAAVGNEGPIPAIVCLFSVLLLIRLRARQTAPSRE